MCRVNENDFFLVLAFSNTHFKKKIKESDLKHKAGDALNIEDCDFSMVNQFCAVFKPFFVSPQKQL